MFLSARFCWGPSPVTRMKRRNNLLVQRCGSIKHRFPSWPFPVRVSIYRPSSFCSRDLHFWREAAFAPPTSLSPHHKISKPASPIVCGRFHAHPSGPAPFPCISLTNSLYPVATSEAAMLPTIVPTAAPRQLAFGQQQPVVPRMFDQPAPGLHQPLL